MKRTISYSSVEKVVYEFDEADIKRALFKEHKIKPHEVGRRIEFEIYEDGESHIAEATIIYEKPKELDGESRKARDA